MKKILDEIKNLEHKLAAKTPTEKFRDYKEDHPKSTKTVSDPLFQISEAPYEGKTFRATHRDPKGETAGEYGKAHYTTKHKDVAEIYLDHPKSKIHEFNVKHPKVIHVNVPMGSDDDAGHKKLLNALSKHTGIKAKNWDEMNAELKKKGYGGVSLNHSGNGQSGHMFLGYGDHLQT